jgi:hypothetical protein
MEKNTLVQKLKILNSSDAKVDDICLLSFGGNEIPKKIKFLRRMPLFLTNRLKLYIFGVFNLSFTENKPRVE